jgi:hypothetical protein
MMIKKSILNVFFIVFLVTLGTSFNSCQKEGVFSPKQKISNIYADLTFSKIYWDPETNQYEIKEETIPKQIVQGWTWDKNKLSKIDYWDAYFWGWDYDKKFTNEIWKTDRYFYKNNRLTKIEHDRGFFTNVLYSGSKYNRMESYDCNQNLWLAIDFTYSNNKISKIIVEYTYEYFWDLKTEYKLLSTIFPKSIISKVAKKSEKTRKAKKTESMIFVVNYTYNGDNVNEMAVEIDWGGGEIDKVISDFVSHDTKSNPFYKRMGVIVDEDFGFFGFGTMFVSSKNNPLEIKIKYSEIYGGDSDDYEGTQKYTYTYNKDFPTEVIQVFTFDDDEPWTNKIFYEYK